MNDIVLNNEPNNASNKLITKIYLTICSHLQFVKHIRMFSRRSKLVIDFLPFLVHIPGTSQIWRKKIMCEKASSVQEMALFAAYEENRFPN